MKTEQPVNVTMDVVVVAGLLAVALYLTTLLLGCAAVRADAPPAIELTTLRPVEGFLTLRQGIRSQVREAAVRGDTVRVSLIEGDTLRVVFSTLDGTAAKPYTMTKIGVGVYARHVTEGEGSAVEIWEKTSSGARHTITGTEKGLSFTINEVWKTSEKTVSR